MNGTDSPQRAQPTPSPAPLEEQTADTPTDNRNAFVHAAGGTDVVPEEAIAEHVRSHIDFFIDWLLKTGIAFHASDFDGIHRELYNTYGAQDRAMLYRSYYSDMDLASSIGAVRPLGLLGIGGSSRIYYSQPDIRALDMNAGAFVKEVVGDWPQKAKRLVEAKIRKNIAFMALHHRKAVTKVLFHPKTKEPLIRFKREMRRMMEHFHDSMFEVMPWVVGGEMHGPEPHFHMMYEPGADLSLLRRAAGGSLDIRLASDVFAQIARLLEICNLEGVAHLDIKPENIFMGEDSPAKILDLGIAKNVEDDSQNITSGPHGTPRYIAPERAADSGFITEREDVYSAGHLFVDLIGASVPSHFPRKSHTPRNVTTHREWMFHNPDKCEETKIYFPEHVMLHAQKDRRWGKYLHELEEYLEVMLHADHRRRPKSDAMLTFFFNRSRYARMPIGDFLKTGMEPRDRQILLPKMTDPGDPMPLLARLSQASRMIGEPSGYDFLNRYDDDSAGIRKPTTQIFVRTKGKKKGAWSWKKTAFFAAALGGAAAAGSAYYLSREGQPEKRIIPANRSPAMQPERIETADHELTVPTLIVRPLSGEPPPAGYEGLPIDHALTFTEGALLSQGGHPRGFELRTATPIQKLSVYYSIDAVRADPTKETSMTAFFLTEDEQRALREFFGETGEMPMDKDKDKVNAFLFCRGSDHLTLLPGGLALHIREENGQAVSTFITPKTASADVRKLCQELRTIEFRGYVSPTASMADVEKILRNNTQKARSMLQMYAEASQ